jgi:DNA-binding NtrC family response regulator
MYNVLIADDDVDSWFQVNALLRKYLVKASFVTNLQAAKQYIDRQLPAILFFEKDLQDHSALDFIKYVRAKYPFAKVIMINHYGEGSMGFRSRADFTISKKFIPEVIEEVLMKLLDPGSQQLAPA